MPVKHLIKHIPGMESRPGDDVEQDVCNHVGSARYSSWKMWRTVLPMMRVKNIMGTAVSLTAVPMSTCEETSSRQTT